MPSLSARELRAEGAGTHHCVARYEPEVATIRNAYVYRVVAPRRATLASRRTHRGWTIAGLSGPRDRPVSPETRSRVQAWFDSVAGTGAAAG